MSALVLDAGTSRRELAGVIAPGDDAHALAAYARSIWAVLVEPGDRVAGELVRALGPVAALGVALTDSRDPGHVSEAGLTADEIGAGRRRWQPRLGAVASTLANARRAGVRLVIPEDREWPARVDDLGPFAPLCLWVRGEVCLLAAPRPAVAIVGARAASGYGEHVAAELAAEAGAAGIAVYSGAAYGIDAAAHRAALSAVGPTIAVMAGGVERAYPSGNRDLIDRIARAGAVVAEVPCGTAPTKHRFLARNRLIAALSDGTVVVEAGWRSGSLNTAHHAQAIGRPVGVVPGPITSASSRGCHRLLREGDAVCITGIDDMRDLIGASVGGALDAGATDAYTGERTRVLDALSLRSPRSTEDIAQRAGFSLDEAAALLGLLELEGRAERRERGWVGVGGMARPAMLW